ncbi:MAG: ROK family protein [Coprobacillaceae bacterium]
MYHLGIDIGGTFIKYAIIRGEKEIIKKWKKKSIKFDDKDMFYDYLCNDIPEINTIDYIGISAPGVINEQSIVMSEAGHNVRIMYQTNINKEVIMRLNKPTFTINDAKAAGYCELKIGNALNSKSSAYYIIGTGIGGAFCDEGGIINGIDSLAGELSCLPFTIKEGQIISASHYASMSALISIYNQKVVKENQLTYGKEICQLYLSDNSVAKEAVDEWCLNIVFALITIVICYNPDIICIGGGISEEDWFIEEIQKTYAKHFPKRFLSLVRTRIERCLYNNDANILGAVLFAREQYNSQ